MSKERIVLIKTNNVMTTGYYYDILQKSLERVFRVVDVCKNLQEFHENNKSTPIMVGDVMDAFRLFLKGYKNILVWVQGVKPEECLYAEQKKLKAHMEAIIEKWVLKKIRFCIFVSQTMKEHYSQKYKLNFENHYYIMPCFNEKFLHEEAFVKKEEIFAYVGSIVKWQCFEEMVKMYVEIEKKNESVSLLVLTPQKEKAEEILRAEKVKRYQIAYADKKELGTYLEKVKYGFVLRENNPVNNVATPTKFSTYCAYGAMPIFTKYIGDFYNQTKNLKHIVALPSLEIEAGARIIQKHMHNDNNLDSIKQEFTNLFEGYYNTKMHEENLAKQLQKL